MTKGAHALYPGSFDVLTFGHLDLLRRATRVFKKVTIAVAINTAKKNVVFSVEERLDMIRQAVEIEGFDNVEARSFNCLTVEFARQIKSPVILRGLRAISDFEYELQMAMTNDTLDSGITTVFMAPSPQYVFLSSTIVKEIAKFGGNISEFVPAHVAQALRSKLGAEKLLSK